MKKSVPRISKLQYCLKLAKRCANKGVLEIEKKLIDGKFYEVPKDAYVVIFKYREEEEEIRRLLTRRYVSPEKRREKTKGKYLVGIASELIKTLHRWKFLHKIGSTYECSQDFKLMGKVRKTKAKEILLKKILNHEPLFTRFLFTLRDSSLREDGEVKSGAVYCNQVFMKNLETNPVSLDVLCAWGNFFGLSYDHKIEIDGKVQRKLFLTCSIAYVHEVLEFLKSVPSKFEKTFLVHKERWSSYKTESILNFLMRLNIAKKIGSMYYLTESHFDTEKLIALAKTKGIILSGNGGLPFFIAKNIVNEESFKKAVIECYKGILSEAGVYAPISVWIEELRAATCEKLRIPAETFDSLLIKLYERYMEYVWLIGASRAMRQAAAKGRHIVSGKPLKYKEKYFSFVTLVWEKME
jgi:hypothetical protein